MELATFLNNIRKETSEQKFTTYLQRDVFLQSIKSKYSNEVITVVGKINGMYKNFIEIGHNYGTRCEITFRFEDSQIETLKLTEYNTRERVKVSGRICYWRKIGSDLFPYAIDLQLMQIEKFPELQNPKKGACFVATEIYGDYDIEEVKVLRHFRDNYLKKHLLGMLFIESYYLIGPIFARLVKDNNFLKQIIKERLLEPLIKKVKKYSNLK